MSLKERARDLFLVTSIAAVALLSPVARAQDDAAPSCESEEYRQFDFWVGEWVVKTADGTVAGENRIEKILDGCVLQENWTGSRGTNGKSFNMYFAREGRWRQTWVDSGGSRLDLEGGLVGKKMVLSGTMPGRDGGPVLHEISWTPQRKGRVVQHWRASRDGGKTWRDLFVGTYERKG